MARQRRFSCPIYRGLPAKRAGVAPMTERQNSRTAPVGRPDPWPPQASGRERPGVRTGAGAPSLPYNRGGGQRSWPEGCQGLSSAAASRFVIAKPPAGGVRSATGRSPALSAEKAPKGLWQSASPGRPSGTASCQRHDKEYGLPRPFHGLAMTKREALRNNTPFCHRGNPPVGFADHPPEKGGTRLRFAPIFKSSRSDTSINH